MKLKCWGCDEIITPDMTIAFGGRDWCPCCHEDLGRDFDEMERAASRLADLIQSEIHQLTR